MGAFELRGSGRDAGSTDTGRGVSPGGWTHLAGTARDGDREAFDALFALVAERLRVYVRLRTGPALGARLEPVEVLQETYLQAWRSRESFDFAGEREFLHWLCRIAENRLRDLAAGLGAAKRRPDGERVAFDGLLERARESATGPVTAAARSEARERLHDGLAELEDAEREVLLQRFFQGRELADIGARLGLSVSAVRRRLARGIERLGRAVGPDPGGVGR